MLLFSFMFIGKRMGKLNPYKRMVFVYLLVSRIYGRTEGIIPLLVSRIYGSTEGIITQTFPSKCFL